MEVPTIQKQQFKNNTGGWIGVVVINAKGEDVGASVEPDGTVWLSEQEQILTANAPRRAEDNPFVAKEYERVNPDTSEIEKYTVTPLTPISENRYVPAGDRPVPGIDSASASAIAAADATADEPVQSRIATDPVGERSAEVDAEGREAAVQPPPRARAAATAVEEPSPAGETQDEAPSPVTAEETAQAAPAGQEETGAAVQPTGEPATGEFASHEEVGTPGAAAAGPPAPWSPGSESPEQATDAGRQPPPAPSGE